MTNRHHLPKHLILFRSKIFTILASPDSPNCPTWTDLPDNLRWCVALWYFERRGPTNLGIVVTHVEVLSHRFKCDNWRACVGSYLTVVIGKAGIRGKIREWLRAQLKRDQAAVRCRHQMTGKGHFEILWVLELTLRAQQPTKKDGVMFIVLFNWTDKRKEDEKSFRGQQNLHCTCKLLICLSLCHEGDLVNCTDCSCHPLLVSHSLQLPALWFSVLVRKDKNQRVIFNGESFISGS